MDSELIRTRARIIALSAGEVGVFFRLVAPSEFAPISTIHARWLISVVCRLSAHSCAVSPAAVAATAD